MTRICTPSDPDRDHLSPLPAHPPGRLREGLPEWLPAEAATYLSHVAAGQSLRALARARGCHASTVMRQVRRVEARREDPLVDEALERAGRFFTRPDTPATTASEETTSMRDAAIDLARTPGAPEEKIAQEARRILRRLCEKGAFLAVAPNMEKAVVLREVVPGRQNRIAVVEREVAHAFALREWIACEKPGKVSCYAITSVGRAALKRLLLEDRERRGGFAEAQSAFQGQHRLFAERAVMAEDGSGERRLRFNLAESPLLVLGRKRDKDGIAYLTPELIEAGERLREDFELAGLGPRVTQNWERFLTAGASRGAPGPRDAEGSPDARTRVAKAMEALGPGLSDIVFRICCFLEGIETAEKRLGWSARSGKVVLKIALERLAAHYGLSPRGQRAAG
ncbi:DUF6456 domain-containing protein [Amaricoccus solimangrovi]|uniref:DUF6456 domain-containing protein n=1 Tax=Amaricoccus solimangrovi TaxID=2589815 RepID=UPI001F33A9EC|nr:DUF6456 domain-containing protein [Amaricoccus solimangrovi]